MNFSMSETPLQNDSPNNITNLSEYIPELTNKEEVCKSKNLNNFSSNVFRRIQNKSKNLNLEKPLRNWFLVVFVIEPFMSHV